MYSSDSSDDNLALVSTRWWHAGFMRSHKIRIVLTIDNIRAVLMTMVRQKGVVSSVIMVGGVAVAGA